MGRQVGKFPDLSGGEPRDWGTVEGRKSVTDREDNGI